mgnify:CR=1 FL=1
MTREETDDLKVHLEHPEDWAPNTYYLVTKLVQEYAEQREEIRVFSEQVNVANQELLKRAEEITRLKKDLGSLSILLLADQKTELHVYTPEESNKEITRLRELIEEAKSVAQMAMSFDAEEYPTMVGEAIAFLDAITQEPT